MSKYWDYEDDHDWDDDYDYAANGYVYWYGKYYPKEEIDALFDDSSSNAFWWLLLSIAGIGIAGYGIYKNVFSTTKCNQEKNDEEVEKKQSSKKRIIHYV